MKLHQKPFRFEKKTYGRGRNPTTRQGRAITIAYITIMITASQYTPHMNIPKLWQGLLMLGVGVGGAALLIFICYLKGPKPERKRGEKTSKK